MNTKTVDEAWSWIEGLKDGKWMPLYCYRAKDEDRMKGTCGYLNREFEAGRPVQQDELYKFSKFRIHPAGVEMNSVVSIDDIRSDVDLENLARILSKFNQTTCGAQRGSTGEICVLPMFHDGKHSGRMRDAENSYA